MASTTTTPASSVKLPSISELTSRSPLNEESQLSPRNRELPNLTSTGFTFKYPLKPSTPANYVTNESSEHKLPSLYHDKPSTQAGGIQLPAPQQASSTSSSPASHYQYYPYHHSPVSQAQGPAGAAVPQAAPVLGYTTSPTSYYHQPIYYQNPSGAPVPQYPVSQQYVVPEVINKPTNKCHRCGTTETPEWRRGPNGVRTLCNACGLFHAKLVKRKGAALAAEEVLNNKVCKGKNGRRISLKKHLLNESLMKNAEVKPMGQPQPAYQLPVNTLPLPPPMYNSQPQQPGYGAHHIPQHTGGYSHLAVPLVRY